MSTAIAEAYAQQTGALADLDQRPAPPEPTSQPAPHPAGCQCSWHREPAA